jgi:hypothetical protein
VLPQDITSAQRKDGAVLLAVKVELKTPEMRAYFKVEKGLIILKAVPFREFKSINRLCHKLVTSKLDRSEKLRNSAAG